ncbi:MAG: hypothetical protein K6360_02905 [Deltaproteobacteria bacterium]
MSPESPKVKDAFFEELQEDDGPESVPALNGEPIEEGQKVAEAESVDGTVLSDDELWDANAGPDDVSLFDDLSQKIEEIDALSENQKQETPQEGGLPESPLEDESDKAPAPPLLEESLESEGASGPVVVRERPFLAWGMTALSTILAAGGVYLLWVMGLFAQSPATYPLSPAVATSPVSPVSPVAQPADQTSRTIPSPAAGKGVLPQMETLGLAPFLIPANQRGELVFLSLTVELSLPDDATKQELSRKEAWVRDAIYRELKGIDLSSHESGDLLVPYRKSLLDRLNREFAPLRVEDVKLNGVVLK